MEVVGKCTHVCIHTCDAVCLCVHKCTYIHMYTYTPKHHHLRREEQVAMGPSCMACICVHGGGLVLGSVP